MILSSCLVIVGSGLTDSGTAASGTAASATTDSTTAAAAATTVVSRTVLEDFPNCGEKGTSTRVVGGTEVVQNEYPWLCSLKYKVPRAQIHPPLVCMQPFKTKRCWTRF